MAASFSALATQYHSISFGDNNTWDAWRLIPKKPPMVAPPEPKLNYVDVEGTDGALDFTSSLDSTVHYKRRTGSWEFLVNNWELSNFNPVIYYRTLMAALHGQQFDIVLADDPTRHYYGRVWLEEWNSDPSFSTITIDYNIEPYHYASSEDHTSKTGGAL